MSEFYLKYTDNLPVLRSELTDINGYIDLTTASNVSFIYQLKSRKYGPTTGSATVISTVSGLVEYAWPTATNVTGGIYYGEWRVVFSNGKQLTIPNEGQINFRILSNLT